MNTLVTSGTIEYKMPTAMAKEYLAHRKGDNVSRMTPNEYLCKVVNEEFGLKGYCVRVIEC